MLDLVEEFRSIVSALEAAEVPFAVCGGLAVAIHSQPRATVDVDLLLPRDQIDSCKAVVRELGYTIEAGPMVIRQDVIEMHRMSKADEESGDLLSIDLLVVTQDLEPVWSGRTRVGWAFGELPVVSRAGLIQMSACAGAGRTRTTSDVWRRSAMTKIDMSPKAVTVRLIRTAQLRRLCLQLRPSGKRKPSRSSKRSAGSR